MIYYIFGFVLCGVLDVLCAFIGCKLALGSEIHYDDEYFRGEDDV